MTCLFAVGPFFSKGQNWVAYDQNNSPFVDFASWKSITFAGDSTFIWDRTTNGYYIHHASGWSIVDSNVCGDLNYINNDLEQVRRMAVQEDTIWIASSSQGLNYYLRSQNSLTQVRGTGVNQMVKHRNHIWYCSESGADTNLYEYAAATETIHNSTTSNLPSSSRIIAIESDGDTLWILYSDRILAGFANNNCVTDDLSTLFGVSIGTGTKMAVDNQDNVWIVDGTNGLAKFHGSSWTVYNSGNSPLPSNKIYDVAADVNGNVWLGIRDIGLVKFDGTNAETIHVFDSTGWTPDIPWVVEIDPRGNIWSICGRNIFVYNPNGLIGPVDIQEPTQSTDVLIYPNPTTGSVKIIIPENLHPRKIEIINFEGRSVYQASLDKTISQEVSVELSPLQSGIYYLRVLGDTSITSKVLVKR